MNEEENPFPEPVELEITDSIDLHSVQPRDIRAVVEAYLFDDRADGSLTFLNNFSPSFLVRNILRTNFLQKGCLFGDLLFSRLEFRRESGVAAFEVSDVMLSVSMQAVEVEHIRELKSCNSH